MQISIYTGKIGRHYRIPSHTVLGLHVFKGVSTLGLPDSSEASSSSCDDGSLFIELETLRITQKKHENALCLFVF